MSTRLSVLVLRETSFSAVGLRALCKGVKVGSQEGLAEKIEKHLMIKENESYEFDTHLD